MLKCNKRRGGRELAGQHIDGWPGIHSSHSMNNILVYYQSRQARATHLEFSLTLQLLRTSEGGTFSYVHPKILLIVDSRWLFY